jgi:type I restriction enzyme S subunit
MENGKGAIVQGLKSIVGIGSTEFHVLRPKKESDLFYIYYLTKMPFFRKMAERHMTGSAGQKRVPTKFLENFKIYLPSEGEREKLGNKCHKIWIEKKRQESFFQSTRNLRQSLINSIF